MTNFYRDGDDWRNPNIPVADRLEMLNNWGEDKPTEYKFLDSTVLARYIIALKRERLAFVRFKDDPKKPANADAAYFIRGFSWMIVSNGVPQFGDPFEAYMVVKEKRIEVLAPNGYAETYDIEDLIGGSEITNRLTYSPNGKKPKEMFKRTALLEQVPCNENPFFYIDKANQRFHGWIARRRFLKRIVDIRDLRDRQRGV